MKDISPIHAAFLWHMHQPVYKDPIDGAYLLPWVRLHGTKDYYDMAHILEKYTGIHQTFNIVPSLTEQIIDYTEYRAGDRFLEITIKPADALTLDDKCFLLDKFFFANWENMVMPFPRYSELLKKRGLHLYNETLSETIRYYTVQDFLDLQVLFNLAWIDPSICEQDDFLKYLVRKGRNFSEDEKLKLIEKQYEILKNIIPEYKRLQDLGIIELTTSPYYHPILPLLCDSDSAKESMPWVELPNSRFIHPEDAEMQVTKGLKYHEKIFGRMPLGMWPSEGGVSEDAVSLIARSGINWIATDEKILEQSLGKHIRRDDNGRCLDPHTLYKPYKWRKDDRELSIVFRDRILSDLIGFVYSKWDAEKAADDFIARVLNIRESLGKEIHGHLVTIVLDGENAWEYYKNDGNDFLNALYSRLSENNLIRCVTISEHLKGCEPPEKLPRLYAGSWINHNFKIWIGHEEDNTAWDYLSDARAELILFENNLKKDNKELTDDENSKLQEAWERLYAAEGSDWFWWYGEEHSSMNDIEFDELFRRHIKKLYMLIGKEPPSSLDVPIISEEQVYEPVSRPVSFINPKIDGEVTNYFEWLSAGSIEVSDSGTAMHRNAEGGSIIHAVNYGFSPDSMSFRFDFAQDIAPSDITWGFIINIFSKVNYKIEAQISRLSCKSADIFERGLDGQWTKTKEVKEIAVKDVVEIAVPFDAVGLNTRDEIRFFITIFKDEISMERWPKKGYIVERIPDADFDLYNWRV